MGKITGFLEIHRAKPKTRPVPERIRDWREVYLPVAEQDSRNQGARCMDCSIPFCHQGCPLGNLVPDWNDLVYRNRWRSAIDRLHATNNFPEWTGRLCPAPCEASCVLSINDDPVTIKSIELSIIERAFDEGWISPEPPAHRTDKRVAIIGSGPAGLAAAQQLNRAGHLVTVFERDDRIGGLLRYGIPDFKMEKFLIDRRLDQMRAEGVEFKTNHVVGAAPIGAGNAAASVLEPSAVAAGFDAVVLAGGAEEPRNLPVPGRELDGVMFAMDFLPLQNRRVAGDAGVPPVTAAGKHVVIIGGGDTGSDCVGTSNRHGAASVTQFELLPMPPDLDKNPVWPYWPQRLRTSSSHEEGANRDWAVATKRLEGKNGKVEKLIAARIEWKDGKMQEMPGSEFEMKADLVLLAMGFVSPVQAMLDGFGVAKDARGNAKAATDGAGSYATSAPKIFAAGDLRRGQSLIVWAIREGRQCARAVDEFLMGTSVLPR